LWSAQNSLKRDHKRKFNRSLCGVLLGISIVLVILGILGIIGIAVYLGGKHFTEITTAMLLQKKSHISLA
jgi:peptidoglycan biosynthesis protein MviN/MurJ (putative lipid II flippase)